jgi:hypothetical protein
MKQVLPESLEAGRIAGRRSYGPYGYFRIMGPCGCELWILSSGADYPEVEGWEHVSVSRQRHPPNWEEMCFVKDLLWDAEEVVVQFHPRRSQYVNVHPNCLHLWRHVGGFPEPPAILVGP